MTINIRQMGFVALTLLIPFILIACQSGPTEVNVSLEEWEIIFDQDEVKTGEITFVVNNIGLLEHNFKIDGVAGEIELILSQDSQTLTVTLDPGTYSLICDLPGHREAGMELQFSVSP